MFVMLFTIGLPLFFVEITIAQYSGKGPLEVWQVVPMLQGIGVCSLLIAGFISLYYNVLICYSLIYLISSFFPTLPWTECDNSWNNEKCCIPSIEKDLNGTIFNRTFCSNMTESPAKQYFK
jgi:solute carrier family 6 amino acid transporter-like protein 5/7/9/14